MLPELKAKDGNVDWHLIEEIADGIVVELAEQLVVRGRLVDPGGPDQILQP